MPEEARAELVSYLEIDVSEHPAKCQLRIDHFAVMAYKLDFEESLSVLSFQRKERTQRRMSRLGSILFLVETRA